MTSQESLVAYQLNFVNKFLTIKSSAKRLYKYLFTSMAGKYAAWLVLSPIIDSRCA